VDIETCSDSGGGYNVGWTEAGEWIEYSVNVAASGVYRLDVRYAAFGGGTYHFELDGINKTGPLTNGNTGGWQIWQTLTRSNVALNAGQHVLRFALDANGGNGYVGNFNYFQFTLLASNSPPSCTLSNPGPGAVFSAPANITLRANASDSGAAVSKVEFFADGNVIGTDTTSPFSVTWSNVAIGTYTLMARATDNVGLIGESSPVSISVSTADAVQWSATSDPGTIQSKF
jgi:hypothetical protein